jgi:hypothetical protein
MPNSVSGAQGCAGSTNGRATPSLFARLLVQYQRHPEAKSLAPDGTACQPETIGLLKRAHVIAGDIRYVGKESDRKWEEGEDLSVLEFAATEYGRTRKVLASQEVKDEIGRIGINKCARESGFDRKNFIRKLVRDIPVKRNSYREFVKWLQRRKSRCAQPFHCSMASVNDHPTQIRRPSSPRQLLR